MEQETLHLMLHLSDATYGIFLWVVLLTVCAVAVYGLGVTMRTIWTSTTEARAAVAAIYARVITLTQPGVCVSGRERLEAAVRGTEYRVKDESGSNPHRTAAAVRSAVDKHINNSIQNAGLVPWSLSSSSKDKRRGIAGQRYHRTVKDGKMDYQNDPITKKSVIKLIDVDHYLCWKEVTDLVMEGVPLAIYALAPKTPNGRCGEMTFSYSSEKRAWKFMCPATEPYTHKLWNWGASDHYYFKRILVTLLHCQGTCALLLGAWYFWWLPLLLIPWMYYAPTCSTLVETVVIDRGDNREEVWLFPTRTFGPLGTLMRLTMDAPELKRIEPNLVQTDKGMKYNVMRVQGRGPVQYSVGLDEGDSHVTVPKVLIERCQALRGQQTSNLSCGAVIAEANKMDVKLTNGEAAMLLQAGQVNFGHKCEGVFVHERDFSYSPCANIYTDESRPSMRSFMSPLCDIARAPRLGAAATQAAYEHRVKRVKSHQTTISDHMSQCAVEFAKHLREKVGVCQPASEDEIYAAQSRPTQRMILDRVKDCAYEAMTRVSCFVKREAYPSGKAPRFITTSDKGKMRFSQYCRGICNTFHEKGVPWYAFGHSNKEIAQLIVDTVAGHDHVDETDFSKFDGTYSPAYRQLELLFYEALIDPSDWPEFHALLVGTYNNSVSTGEGWSYEQGTARGSGFPDTSVGNSLANAFVNYAAIRSARLNGSFYDAEQAWAKLGLYGGDDGLTAGLPLGALDKQATSLGFRIKSTRRLRERRDHVTFLARVWGPDVWDGDDNSCTDIKRQVGKLHLTACAEADLAVIRAKAQSIVVNDANTPILGDWARTVLRVTDRRSKQVAKAVARAQQTMYRSEQIHDPEGAFPNKRADWMNYLVDTDFGAPDLDAFNKWCVEATQDTLFTPPAIRGAVEFANELDEPMVVEGLVVEPAKAARSAVEKKETKPPAESKQEVSTKPESGSADQEPCVDCKGPNFVDKRWFEKMRKKFPSFARPKRCAACLRKRAAQPRK